MVLGAGHLHVSAFAFGVENFKRSQAEVDALMALAEEKLLHLAEVCCCGSQDAHSLSAFVALPPLAHLRP